MGIGLTCGNLSKLTLPVYMAIALTSVSWKVSNDLFTQFSQLHSGHENGVLLVGWMLVFTLVGGSVVVVLLVLFSMQNPLVLSQTSYVLLQALLTTLQSVYIL